MAITEEYEKDQVVVRDGRKYVAGCDGKLTRVAQSDSYRAKRKALIMARLQEEGI